MKQFGQFLIDKGAINKDQLHEALQCQVTFGGRLGTNLVELGYMSLNHLAAHLAEFTKVPNPPAEALAKVTPEVLECVPKSVAEQFKVVPLQKKERQILVAMADPHDPKRVDELAFALSLRVHAYLIPELRIYYWLERYYGIKRSLRYVNVGREMAKGRFLTPIVPELPSQASTGPASNGHFGSVGHGQELTDEKSFQKIYADRDPNVAKEAPGARGRVPEPQGPPAHSDSAISLDLVVSDDEAVEESPPPSETRADAGSHATIAHLAVEREAAIAQAKDREELMDAALGVASLLTEVSALFAVHQGMVQGYRGSGGGLEGLPVDGIIFPVSTEALITTPADKGEGFRGTPPDSHLDLRFLAALRRQEVQEVVALPVKIRGRVVNVLYADNGTHPIPDVCYAALLGLVEQMGAAYEGLILKRKSKADEAED